MPNSGTDPLQEALEEMPHRWYEKGQVNAFIPAWLGGLAAGYAYHFHAPEVNTWLERVGGAGMAITTAYLDRKSTRDIIGTIEEARREGIVPTYEESNPLIGDVKTVEEYQKKAQSPKIMALEGLFVVSSGLSSIAAFPLSAIRGVAALNNHRKEMRVQRAIEISKEK